MDEQDLQMLAEQPGWLRVLSGYRSQVEAILDRPESETGPRWAARLGAVAELTDAELAAIHGRLIAYGWLTFELEEDAAGLGLKYRVTSEGRRALERLAGAAEGETVMADEPPAMQLVGID
jgi:hypothetical protein